jgi:hypothetical protein
LHGVFSLKLAIDYMKVRGLMGLRWAGDNFIFPRAARFKLQETTRRKNRSVLDMKYIRHFYGKKPES